MPPLPAQQAGMPELVPVLERHRFDEAALARYLRDHLPGFDGPVQVRQFQGGQSNPTFHLATSAGDYVLRKKPPGKLLPSAHAVERDTASCARWKAAKCRCRAPGCSAKTRRSSARRSSSWTTCPAASSRTG